jgi:hypothetical protein
MQKAYFYVCGDAANMAREVNTVLAKIISEQRDIPESKAEEIVKGMRSANQYQVGKLSPHILFWFGITLRLFRYIVTDTGIRCLQDILVIFNPWLHRPLSLS